MIYGKNMQSKINFKRKNLISCTNLPFKTLMWEYICWVLAGKPDNYRRKIK